MPLHIGSNSIDVLPTSFVHTDNHLDTDIFIIHNKNWCPGTLSIKFQDIIIASKPNNNDININVYYLGSNTNVREISNDEVIEFEYMKIYDQTNTNYFVIANAKDQEHIKRNLEDVCKGVEDFSMHSLTTTNNNKENNEIQKVADIKQQISKSKYATKRNKITTAIYTAHTKNNRSAFDQTNKLNDSLNEDNQIVGCNEKEKIILNKCALSIQTKEMGCQLRAIQKRLDENVNNNILTDKEKANLEIMRGNLESEWAKIPEDVKKITEEVEIYVAAIIERDNFNKTRSSQSEKRSLSQEMIEPTTKSPSRSPLKTISLMPEIKKMKLDKLNGMKKLKK